MGDDLVSMTKINQKRSSKKNKVKIAKKTQNQQVINILLELSLYEENIQQDRFRSEAYRKAANVLEKLNAPIKSGKEAKKLRGIGSSIADKIDEFLTTGKVQKLEAAKKKACIPVVELFTQISGIGPSKARELIKQGITTLDQLQKHKNLLNHHQLLGLRYYKELNQRMTREEVRKIEQIINKEILKLNKSHRKKRSKYKVTICG